MLEYDIMINDEAKNLSFEIGQFILSFPTNVSYETYDVPDNYYGIIFWDSEKNKFDVMECIMGTRILINSKTEGIKDMPFNMGTAEFLPHFVKTRELK